MINKDNINEQKLKENLNCCISNTRNIMQLISKYLINLTCTKDTFDLIRDYTTTLTLISDLQHNYMTSISTLFTVDESECCNLYLLQDVTTKFTIQVKECNQACMQSYNYNVSQFTYDMCKNYIDNITKLYRKYTRYLGTQFSCINK